MCLKSHNCVIPTLVHCRYPTLKLIGGSLKAPIEFDRDRSVQGMMEFLEMHVPVVPDDVVAGDSAAQAKAEL